MKRKEYVVIVEWKNVFSESYDTEIPCTSKVKAEKLVKDLSRQYHDNHFIQEYKVYYICR